MQQVDRFNPRQSYIRLKSVNTQPPREPLAMSSQPLLSIDEFVSGSRVNNTQPIREKKRTIFQILLRKVIGE